VLDTAGALIVVLDKEGRITRFNRACEALTGYPAAEVLGRVLWEFLIPPEELPGVHQTWEALQAGDFPNQHENHWLARDGSRRLIAWSNTAIVTPDGRIDSIIGTGLDITQRKLAEAALERSERLYRAIGESIDYGVWVCEPDGRNIYASPSFLKLVGLTQEQCSNFGWGDVLHPDDAARTIAAWKECVRTGGTWDIEHRFRGVDGQWHPILARGVPVRDQQGRVTCWAGINLDISRLKQTEAEVHRHADEFRAANEELARFNRAMVGRELRMVELKQEVNALCARLGQPPRYPIQPETEPPKAPDSA
jgi:PAS domain S-box-containing protein